MRILFLSCLAVVASAACTSSQHYSGDLMGSFQFTTDVPTLVDGGWDAGAFVTCPNLSELPPTNFTFEATFSEIQSTGAAFETVGGVERSGTFDGQYFTSTLTAPREFDDADAGCSCAADAGTLLQETLAVALLSQEQVLLIGNQCPGDPLDGGVPDLDAGPRFTAGGFDALLACGTLVDVIVVPPGCSCAAVDGGPCTMSFPVSGARH